MEIRRYLGKMPKIGNYLNSQAEANFFSLELDGEWKALLPSFIQEESVIVLKSTEELNKGIKGYIIQLNDLDGDDVNIPVYISAKQMTLKRFGWGVDSVVTDFSRKEVIIWLVQESFSNDGGIIYGNYK